VGVEGGKRSAQNVQDFDPVLSSIRGRKLGNLILSPKKLGNALWKNLVGGIGGRIDKEGIYQTKTLRKKDTRVLGKKNLWDGAGHI